MKEIEKKKCSIYFASQVNTILREKKISIIKKPGLVPVKMTDFPRGCWQVSAFLEESLLLHMTIVFVLAYVASVHIYKYKNDWFQKQFPLASS